MATRGGSGSGGKGSGSSKQAACHQATSAHWVQQSACRPTSVPEALILLRFGQSGDGRAFSSQAEAIMAQRQAMARRAMAIHDNLPADVPQAVHEAGDEATERYLAHLSSVEGEDVVDAAPVKRKRGRPRKHLQ